MDNNITELIKNNVTREMGDASAQFKDNISSYFAEVIRDICDYSFWSWAPASETLTNLVAAMPNNFAVVIEYKILSRLDSIEIRDKWLKLSNDELAKRINDDIGKIGVYTSGTNVRLTAIRDSVYWDIANYPYWSWYPAAVASVSDITAVIPDDFESLVKYGILAKMTKSPEYEKLYYMELAQKQDEDFPKIGKYTSGTNATVTGIRDRVYRNVAAYYQWSWLENVPISLSTDSGEEYITIPSYMGKIQSIYREASGTKIELIQPSEYDNYRVCSVATSTAPYLATIKDGRIYFYQPAADGTEFTIFCDINANQLDDDEAEGITGVKSKIPADFDAIIIDGIKMEIDKGNLSANKYYTELEQKKNQDGFSRAEMIRANPSRNSYNARFFTGM